MNKVLSDERLGAKLRVTENGCVLFDSYIYIRIYLKYIEMNRSFPEALNPFTTTLTDLFIFSVKLNPSHVFAKMLLFYS